MDAPAALILASASPRRRQLLAELNVPFEVLPSPLREPDVPAPDLSPRAWAEAVAWYKARSVADLRQGRWVLGADTVVVCGRELLGKPAGVSDARRMLELQARRPSDVITGLALLRVPVESRDASGPLRRGGVMGRLASDVTRVWMRDDAALRERYLATGDWADKAGAYGIQDVGDELVLRIEGSFSNVVGLPLERLRVLLNELAIV